MDMKLLPEAPQATKKKVQKWAIIIAVAALIIWSFTGIPFDGVKDNAVSVTKAIFNGLIHPDWGYVWRGDGEDLVTTLLLTVAIAFLGTFISAIISLPFAFWAARNKNSHLNWLVSGSGKIFLSFVRTFPEIVLALMFTKAVGPGAFAGVLAVGFHSVGMLAKLFGEAIENLEPGSNESVVATGGSKFNVIMFATMPQLLPELVSNTLYRFELAIRSASILGIVGAGGIGTPLIFALQTRSWSRVGIILLGIILMVTLVDFISGSIRKRLI